jgi:hypothetical protein
MFAELTVEQQARVIGCCASFVRKGARMAA